MRRFGIVLGCALVMAACSARQETVRPLPWEAVVPAAGPDLGRWIEVRKTSRTLTVYEGRAPVRTYPVVMGRDPFRAKLYEGDNRTPEGEYRIAAKFAHPRWLYFLLLDYPTEANRLLYRAAREEALLPASRGRTPGIGGEVGIHGTESDLWNERGENWTRGCISLRNRDMEELYSLVDVGTRVVIEK
ncbi:MAG: hypothetical protein KatS3mg076_0728 [Candidatus Binatia bacterium]|nr:MAG: hypothetical protein KatS3mg076_0728 [Candidatus Binatia bacterium]